MSNENEVRRSLDMKMDKAVIAKLSKTRWFKSLPVYKYWKKNRSHKMRQMILDNISFDISLALRGKKLQVFILKTDERGWFSENVRKNGYEYVICCLEDFVIEDAPACMSLDPYWMGAYETEEEAIEVCKEMQWTLCEKRSSNL